MEIARETRTDSESRPTRAIRPRSAKSAQFIGAVVTAGLCTRGVPAISGRAERKQSSASLRRDLSAGPVTWMRGFMKACA